LDHQTGATELLGVGAAVESGITAVAAASGASEVNCGSAATEPFVT
jgi:hypothetical protein